MMELLVVMAIVAILASIAAPSFTQLIESQRARSAVDNLRSSLDLARSEAIKRNSNITVSRVGASWEEGWQVAQGATVLRSEPAVSSLTITSAANALVFNPSGRAATSVSFAIAPTTGSGASDYCVEISLSGKARSKKGPC
ncbi:prepilin-type cleavage/methylation domain-containing protein [Spongiibacter sp. KMU-166]|uniref:Type II secretion system protein H n=1 Tax=Spongiibacter thalassae TaxID=2721624 RepID=A0ABX1GIS3_9GAMM|nr:prepilin-type cleavage/methylation domain-containing protein [Spongiibacter thalassae]